MALEYRTMIFVISLRPLQCSWVPGSSLKQQFEGDLDLTESPTALETQHNFDQTITALVAQIWPGQLYFRGIHVAYSCSYGLAVITLDLQVSLGPGYLSRPLLEQRARLVLRLLARIPVVERAKVLP